MDIFENKKSEQMFLQQLREQFAAFRHNGQRILGGRVIAGFHRSGPIYDKWIEFKEKMRWGRYAKKV
jgi:hypothetical protein